MFPVRRLWILLCLGLLLSIFQEYAEYFVNQMDTRYLLVRWHYVVVVIMHYVGKPILQFSQIVI